MLYGMSSRVLTPWLDTRLQWPAQVILAAGSASLVSLGLQAWSWELQQALDIYPALLGVQCLALYHLGFFRQGRLRDNVRVLTRFGALLACLGLLRELLTDGTLFAHLQWWTGSTTSEPLRVFAAESGVRLAGLIPGAFILLGLLLAGKKPGPCVPPHTECFKGNDCPMNAAKRLEIFRRLHEDNPEPKTELAYTTPFELLIAVILSAQATDVGVNKATARLYPVANTLKRSTRWESTGCPNTSRPSACTTARQRTSSKPAAC